MLEEIVTDAEWKLLIVGCWANAGRGGQASGEIVASSWGMLSDGVHKDADDTEEPVEIDCQ